MNDPSNKETTMSEEKPQAIVCPNCQQLAIRTGNEIACENCDAIFTITKKQGAKVKQLGPIEDHEKRISALEHQDDQPDDSPEDTPAETDEAEEPIL